MQFCGFTTVETSALLKQCKLFILDSGCTIDVSSFRDDFKSLVMKTCGYIRGISGTRIPAVGEGTLDLVLMPNGINPNQDVLDSEPAALPCTIDGAWFAPGMDKRRLLSLARAMKRGASFIFKETGSFYTSPSGVVFPLLHRNNLFYLVSYPIGMIPLRRPSTHVALIADAARCDFDELAFSSSARVQDMQKVLRFSNGELNRAPLLCAHPDKYKTALRTATGLLPDANPPVFEFRFLFHVCSVLHDSHAKNINHGPRRSSTTHGQSFN